MLFKNKGNSKDVIIPCDGRYSFEVSVRPSGLASVYRTSVHLKHLWKTRYINRLTKNHKQLNFCVRTAHKLEMCNIFLSLELAKNEFLANFDSCKHHFSNNASFENLQILHGVRNIM